MRPADNPSPTPPGNSPYHEVFAEVFDLDKDAPSTTNKPEYEKEKHRQYISEAFRRREQELSISPLSSSTTPNGEKNALKQFLNRVRQQKKRKNSIEEDLNKKNLQEKPSAWILSTQANIVFGCVIVVNAICMGVETDLNFDTPNGSSSLVWKILDNIFCAIFTVELLLRLVATKKRFFLDAWNVFDFLLVSIAIVDTWILSNVISSGGDGGEGKKGGDVLSMLIVLRILRLLRLARIFRLFRFFKELSLLISGLFQALRALFWVILLLVIVLYIGGIFATRMIGMNYLSFSDEILDPSDNSEQQDILEFFGSVSRSMFSLFQCMTFEGWADMARLVMKQMPWMWVFFVLYLMFTSYTLMNLVTGVIVDNVLDASRTQNEDMVKLYEKEKKLVIENLIDLYYFFKKEQQGEMSRKEFSEGCQSQSALEKFQLLQIAFVDSDELFSLLDRNNNGSISLEEFIDGMLRIRGSSKSKYLLSIQRDLHRTTRGLDQRLLEMKRLLWNRQTLLRNEMMGNMEMFGEMLRRVCEKNGVSVEGVVPETMPLYRTVNLRNAVAHDSLVQ